MQNNKIFEKSLNVFCPLGKTDNLSAVVALYHFQDDIRKGKLSVKQASDILDKPEAVLNRIKVAENIIMKIVKEENQEAQLTLLREILQTSGTIEKNTNWKSALAIGVLAGVVASGIFTWSQGGLNKSPKPQGPSNKPETPAKENSPQKLEIKITVEPSATLLNPQYSRKRLSVRKLQKPVPVKPSKKHQRRNLHPSRQPE
jgi:hypothetical protein